MIIIHMVVGNLNNLLKNDSLILYYLAAKSNGIVEKFVRIEKKYD